MPRTKVNHKRQGKKNRCEYTEKLRDFDHLADEYLLQLEEDFEERKRDLEFEIHKSRISIPDTIKSMKISELKELGIQNFFERNINTSNSPLPISQGSLVIQQREDNVSHPNTSNYSSERTALDEGYSTVDEARKSSQVAKTSAIPMGPLMSASANKRRSRSAQSLTNLNTPSLSTRLLVPSRAGPKRMTPMIMSQQREARPKFRTPFLYGRKKACSADRVQITPKVQPNTPLALLRHARTGESVFSVTGSPVITAGASEMVANVNIPIGNAILSIRPTEMGDLDPQYIRKIDSTTMNDLKQLQANLNRLMKFANNNDKE